MNPQVKLVDTGPLVGLLNERDQFHSTACKVFATAPTPLHTTWPVITECAWLLRKTPEAVHSLLELVITGSLLVHELDVLASKRIMHILEQYESLLLQLADASLSYLAEQLDTTSLITFDVRDFRVVRLEDGGSFDLHSS